jgi:hypothetical protein
MKQLNIHITPQFESVLKKFMKYKKLNQKSAAIRLALEEGVERVESQKTQDNFLSWVGLGLKSTPNQKPKFKTEDDLW